MLQPTPGHRGRAMTLMDISYQQRDHRMDWMTWPVDSAAPPWSRCWFLQVFTVCAATDGQEECEGQRQRASLQRTAGRRERLQQITQPTLLPDKLKPSTSASLNPGQPGAVIDPGAVQSGARGRRATGPMPGAHGGRRTPQGPVADAVNLIDGGLSHNDHE